MNDLRKSWGQQECSPAGRTHGISLCSRVITPTLPNNSHPEQSVIKKKPGESFSMQAHAERGAATCMQTHESCTEFTNFTDSAGLIKNVYAHLTYLSF